MFRAATILAVLLATTTATAQQSIHPKNISRQDGVSAPDVPSPEWFSPIYKRQAAPSDGWMSPEDRRIEAISRATIEEAKRVMPPVPQPLPGPLPRLPTERVVITNGPGGRLDEHNWRFASYRQAGVDVEIRGACLSACTLITVYVGKDKLCIAPGAYMGFHAVRSLAGKYMPAETDFMYRQFPAEIRSWIDRYGGWDHLLLDGFWYLGDRELWAMGYPKCK